MGEGEEGSSAALGPDPAVGLCRGDSCVQAGGKKCIKSGSELGNTCVGTLVIKGKFNPVPNAPHGGLCQVNEEGTQLNEARAWQSGRHWGGGTADLFLGAAQPCPGHPGSASGSVRLVFSPWLQILLGSGMNLGCCDQGPVWVVPGGSGGHGTRPKMLLLPDASGQGYI